ncbi:DUF2207 domain-containing protein [Lactobacillus sp. ESL0228]|uniref:DUF2207 domain-containing protein n=1 Tax=Lactobacillus sp. ESL0228 TaxID=2069352 RepID=UPI000EFA753A|nr:DUF2207 domain-containing protein [Lactobacillus sp. ESL0228]RMC49031.1 DUF2207 domain-containing protein [Lactobacillus sp. ESL0228]
MKRKLLLLLTFLSVLVLGCSLGQKVKADINYDIENNTAVATVNRDGSITMTRKIVYQFDDAAHGVFYQQNLKPDQKIVEPQVKVRDDRGLNLTDHLFDLQKTAQGYRFKVYHRISDNEKITVTYHYKITRAVTNYEDVAELNFMIIGNNWDTNLNHVKASIIFSKPVKGLKAWAHGPLNGYIKVSPQTGRIVMTVDNIDGKTGVEVHTIFPLSITPDNKKVIHQKHRSAVLKQEKELAQAANRQRRNKRYASWGLTLISIFTGLVALLRGFCVKRQGVKPKKMRSLPHNYEIPDVDPVSAQILDRARKPDVKAFTAYLMQLTSKHKLEITDYQAGRKTCYRISCLDEQITKQDKLLGGLFEIVGDGKTVTTEQIRKYHGTKIGKYFDQWAQQRYRQVQKKGLISKKLINRKKVNQAVIIVLTIISCCSAYFAFNVSNINLILVIIALLFGTGIGLLVANWRISIYSKLGAEKTNQVRGFKHMLSDIGQFKMRNVGDLLLWEDFMPYAVSFDLAKKVLKEINLEFNKEELAQSNFYLYGPFYSSGKNSFAESFSASFVKGAGASASSSIIGSSGGFSGGSSGGFGGGSGGGAF